MSKRRAIQRIQRNQLVTFAMAESFARHGVQHPGVDLDALRLGYVDEKPLEGCVRRLQAAFGISEDGWPGNEFLCRLWADNKPSKDNVQIRVVSAAQMGDVAYVLGAGAANDQWFAKEPDSGAGCDCSAFIAWSLLRRKAGGPDWRNSRGQQNWLHTGSIVHDAQNDCAMFRQIAEPIPWCIFAYADKGGRQGHTGWVVETRNGLEIIDCSSSQSKRLGDGIRQRSGEWLRNRDDVVYCVPVWW